MFLEYLTLSGHDARLVCGLLAAGLGIMAFLPYISDTVQGRTQPDRGTWLVWAVVSSLAAFANRYEGADSSLWFVGVQAAATVVIFTLSIRRGAGAYLSRRNLCIFAVSAVGLILWYLAEEALIMLLITTAISAMSGVPTVIKAYRAPASETLATWVLSLVAAFLGILAVGSWDPALLIYPVYLYVLYAAIVVAILSGRQRVKGAARVQPPFG